MRLVNLCLVAIAFAGYADTASAQTGRGQGAALELAVSAVESFDRVVAGLEAEGYRIVEIRKTFLGRVLILAENGETRREIVLSSTTGEIKRDVIVAGASGGAASAETGKSGSAPGQAVSASARENNRGNSNGRGGSGGNSGGNSGNGNSSGGGNGNGGNGRK